MSCSTSPMYAFCIDAAIGTVLRSKKVDFEYDVLSAVLAKLACSELQFDIQLCQGWGYVHLKLWAVMIFDVVSVCINAWKLLTFMLGTSSGLCFRVKNHHVHRQDYTSAWNTSEGAQGHIHQRLYGQVCHSQTCLDGRPSHLLGWYQHASQAMKLLVKEAICIWTTPESSHFNRNCGYNIPNCWSPCTRSLGVEPTQAVPTRPHCKLNG